KHLRARYPLHPTTENDKKETAVLDNEQNDLTRRITAMQAVLHLIKAGAGRETDRKIAWGKAIHDLQAGLRFAEDYSRGVPNGQRITLQVWLRNVGKKP